MKKLLFALLLFATLTVKAQNDTIKTFEGIYKTEKGKGEIRFSGNTFYFLAPTAFAKYIYEGTYSYNATTLTLNVEKMTSMRIPLSLKMLIDYEYKLNLYTLDIVPAANTVASPLKSAKGRYYKFENGNPPPNFTALIAQANVDKIEAKEASKQEKAAARETAKASAYTNRKGFFEMGAPSFLLLKPSDSDLMTFFGMSIAAGGYVANNSYVGVEIGVHGLTSKEKEVGSFEYTKQVGTQTPTHHTDGTITQTYYAFPFLGTWAYAHALSPRVQFCIGPVAGTTLFSSTYRFSPSVDNTPKMPKETKAAFNFGGETGFNCSFNENLTFGTRYRFLMNKGASFEDDKLGGTMHQIKLFIGITF